MKITYEEANQLLRIVQWNQDAGTSWGEAVSRARGGAES